MAYSLGSHFYKTAPALNHLTSGLSRGSSRSDLQEEVCSRVSIEVSSLDCWKQSCRVRILHTFKVMLGVSIRKAWCHTNLLPVNQWWPLTYSPDCTWSGVSTSKCCPRVSWEASLTIRVVAATTHKQRDQRRATESSHSKSKALSGPSFGVRTPALALSACGCIAKGLVWIWMPPSWCSTQSSVLEALWWSLFLQSCSFLLLLEPHTGFALRS